MARVIAVWDHTILPATHTRTIPAFTPLAVERYRPLAGIMIIAPIPTQGLPG